jgi:hypothetical protein
MPHQAIDEPKRVAEIFGQQSRILGWKNYGTSESQVASEINRKQSDN